MEERFMEVADELTEMVRANAIGQASKKALPSTLLLPEQYLSSECSECGDELPEFRMQRGCLKCVSCQTAQEKREKQRG